MSKLKLAKMPETVSFICNKSKICFEMHQYVVDKVASAVYFFYSYNN